MSLSSLNTTNKTDSKEQDIIPLPNKNTINRNNISNNNNNNKAEQNNMTTNELNLPVSKTDEGQTMNLNSTAAPPDAAFHKDAAHEQTDTQHIILDNNNDEIIGAASPTASLSVSASSEDSKECKLSPQGVPEDVFMPPLDLNAKMEREVDDVRIAIVGNVDSGKSTLVGVLTHGGLDNGRGLARSRVFAHDHEASTGRTSSVSQHIVGVDKENKIIHQTTSNAASALQKNKAWREVVHKSKQTVTFIDLAGHEKYLKTTISGLTGSYCDAAIVVIGANAGISKMTKEHLGVVIALKIPVIVVVTKIDMAPANVLESNKKLLFRILNSRSAGKKPFHVKSEADVQVCASNPSPNLAPVFFISTVTGENLHLLTSYIGQLRPTQPLVSEQKAEEVEFHLDDTFHVSGVGLVLSGTVTSGTIKEATPMLLGPFHDGSFRKVLVKSIQSKRTPVKECGAGHTCSIAVKAVSRKESVHRRELRKGMVLVAENSEPRAVWRFEAEVLVLHHPTTIKSSYQSVLHIGNIRQSAELSRLEVKDSCLRTGDKGRVEFRFISRPEFLKEGQRLIFREGHTKGVGHVKRLIYDEIQPTVRCTPRNKVAKKLWHATNHKEPEKK